jgi:hypothetical protein
LYHVYRKSLWLIHKISSPYGFRADCDFSLRGCANFPPLIPRPIADPDEPRAPAVECLRPLDASFSQRLHLCDKLGVRALDFGQEGVNRPDEYLRDIDRIHQAGIKVWGSFIFGFDNDTLAKIIHECIRGGVPAVGKADRCQRVLTSRRRTERGRELTIDLVGIAVHPRRDLPRRPASPRVPARCVGR